MCGILLHSEATKQINDTVVQNLNSDSCSNSSVFCTHFHYNRHTELVDVVYKIFHAEISGIL